MNAKNVKYAGYLLIFSIVWLSGTGVGPGWSWERLVGIVVLSAAVAWLTTAIEHNARTKDRSNR